MLKTYLYIPDRLKEQISLTAKLQKKSKAEVMRRALEKGVEILNEHGSATSLLKLAEIGRKGKFRGPKDSSQRIDELLWGKNWSK